MQLRSESRVELVHYNRKARAQNTAVSGCRHNLRTQRFLLRYIVYVVIMQNASATRLASSLLGLAVAMRWYVGIVHL